MARHARDASGTPPQVWAATYFATAAGPQLQLGSVSLATGGSAAGSAQLTLVVQARGPHGLGLDE